MTLKLNASDARKIGLAPKRAKHATKGNKAAQQAFIAACKAHGLPEPIAEFRFAPPRKWRFDWAFTCCHETRGENWALEIDGGIWTDGRHTRGYGFLADMEKLNEAALRGWMILRCTPKDVETGKAFALLKRAFGMEP